MNKEKDDLKDMISILIEKGFTDEQIASAIVAYSEEIPAQAPPAGATELDRAVAVIDKVNTKVDNLNGKPVRTIDANGVEIGMSLGAYTTSTLDNGLIDKSVLDKRTTIDIATKAEVNTKAPQATTYTKAEVNAAIASAINALPKSPTRKNITATYKTRKWNANDAGKKVWITVDGEIGIKVGFISEGNDTKFSNGGAVVDLGINYTDTEIQERLFWSTEHVSKVGNISLFINSPIAIHETYYDIIKFEIEE